MAVVAAGSDDQPPSSCYPFQPAATGACKGDYLYCVTEVITALIVRTPISDPLFIAREFYPSQGGGPVYGGVRGRAICDFGLTKAGCRKCLLGAKEWLNWYCSSYVGGFYSSIDCSLSYHQVG
ncbi:hypothetical protein LINGRAHAP2_LOCUS34004 [Linum grandiflorum]